MLEAVGVIIPSLLILNVKNARICYSQELTYVDEWFSISN
jgi:hypothetical protein